MSNYCNKEYLERYLKFEDNYREFINNLNSSLKPKEKLRKIKLFRKRKPLLNSVISLFYAEPNKFFSESRKLLENTSYFDNTETSIFAHYFNILYDKHKNRNSTTINYSIYESNFDSFFKENEKFLLVQDINLDTPLTKLAKMRDKSFFREIYQKLKKQNISTDELLLCANVENKSAFSYIVDDIKYNSEKIQNEEFYYNFIKDNKSLYETLSGEDQKIVKKFISKIIFEIKQYKEENFNDIFHNINDFIMNNKKEKIFNYIYFPFTSDINYLNSLYQICSKPNDYEQLFNLVSFLSKKMKYLKKDVYLNYA
jgi:hypothetical protein